MFPHDSPIFPLFLIECSPQGTEGDGKLSFDFTIDKTIPCRRKISLIFPYPSSSRLLYLFYSFIIIFLFFSYLNFISMLRFTSNKSNQFKFDDFRRWIIQLRDSDPIGRKRKLCRSINFNSYVFLYLKRFGKSSLGKASIEVKFLIILASLILVSFLLRSLIFIFWIR